MLLVITSCLTLTQGSRMGKRIKHPFYSHIWVTSQGEQWQTSHISPPTLARDHFRNDGESIGVVRLPNRTLDGLCPKLPPRTLWSTGRRGFWGGWSRTSQTLCQRQ